MEKCRKGHRGVASRPVRSAGCPYVRILPPVTSALILIWAGPAALAATLYYDFGDTQSNGLFNPQSGGEWDNSTANWWSATTKAPVQFQSGHNVIFRHDNDGAVDLTLTQPVTPGNISVERGDFTIDATATGNLSSVGGWWRDLTVADGASLTYQGSFSGSYNVSVAGNLILSADSATLGLVEIADTGQAVLSSIAGGGITSIARLHNRGDLTIAQGADVSVIHAPARNFADATMQIDGHLSATLANDSGATMDLGSNGTITGSLGNNGLLRLAGGTINGTLNNGGLIQPVIGGAALTVVGDFINGPTGVIAGSADDPLAITADNITLRSGSLIEGQVQLNGAVLNQSVLNLAALDGLHGSLTNAGTVTVDSMVAGNGRALTNTSSFTIGATGNLSALGLLTNTGNLTLDADGRLGAQQIRHDGGSLTSAGLLHADDIRLAATASLSGEIAGRLDVAGGVTTVHGDLTVAATSGPPVTVSGGQLRLANDAHLTADTVMNAGQLYLSSGAVLTGAVTSSGHIGGTGLIDGDLRLTGAATFDVLNNTGTLINAMAAPQTLSGFGPLTAVHVENRGVLSIDQDMAQGLTNATAGDLTILRNVAGHVTSWGKALILPQTGQSGVSLTGGLTVNGGKVVTRGAVGIETTGVSARIGSGAALTVADGALTVSDRLVSNGNLMVQDGAALNAGRINLNGGGAAISGQVTGETVVGAGATLTLDGAWLDGPLSNTGTIGTASATGRGTQLGYVSNSGTAVLGMAGVGVQIDGAVVNSGDLTVTGVVAGTLDNTGTATLTGSFAQVKNSSKAMLTDAHVSGPLSNAAGGNLTVSDGSVAGVLDNAGTATLSGSFAQIDNSGTAVLTDADVTGPIGNTAGGNLTVSGGSVSGVLTNAGNADLTGSFAQIGNSGTATLTDADVSGTVTNAAGGDLSVAQVTTGGLVNHGSLTLTGEVGGAVTNAAGGQTTMTPAALVTGDLMNHGGAILSAAGVIGGDLVNAGAVQMTGDLSVGGDLTNTGNLTQTTGNTTLTIAGQLNQNGNIDNGGFGQITIQAGSVHLGGKSNVGAGVDILGDIIVDGTVDFNQDMVLHDTLIVAASGTMTVAGALDGQGTVAVGNRGKTTVVDGGALTGLSGLNNRGDLTIASGGSVEAGLMTGHAGSSALNAGTLAADVVLNKGATLTSTGVVQGKTSNAGTLLIRGRLTDDLTNAVGGTVTVNGALDARGADLTNNGTVQVKSGVLRADHLLNRGGLMLVAGASAVLGTGAQNIGTISAQGRVVGNLANSGTASLDRQLEGAASNTGTGTMTLAGGATGTVTNAGTLHMGGSFDSDVVNLGTASLAGDVTAGNLSSSGTLSFDAGRTTRLSGVLSLTGGTATVAGDVTAAGVSNAADLTVTGGGRLIGNLHNTGTARLDGVLRGAVLNGGWMELDGTIRGDLANDGGTLVTAGDAIVTGTLTNAIAVPQDTLSQAALTNAATTGSALKIAQGDTLIVRDGVTNNDGGQISIAGQLAGDVTNRGALTLDGTLDGSLRAQQGSADLGGTITGDLIFSGGQMGVGDGLSVGGTVDLRADTSIGPEVELTAGEVVNRAGKALTLAGRINGKISNQGQMQITATGRAKGDVGNADGAVLRAGGNARIDGTLNNAGTVDLRNNSTGNLLRVGGLSGTGLYALDVDLGPDGGDARADRIVVQGGATTGHLELDLNILNMPLESPLDGGVLLIDADDSHAARNTYSYSAANLPLGTEKLVYGLEKTAVGDLLLNYGTNATIGGISANVVLTQSLIGSVVNRPSSPFVTGYAVAEGESRCSPGAWTRATAGRADASGASAARTYAVNSTISASYHGMQFGGDLACFDGYFDGWNMAFGAIGGVNDGSTTQPVYLLEWDGSTWRQTGKRGSINQADFRQVYGGVYMTASRENISADLQLRRERTRLNLNNTPLIEGSAGLGLTDSEFSSNATTISGSLSYAIPLADGWQVVPTAGFALSNTRTGAVNFDDGSKLEIRNSKSRVGFAGATLSRGQVLDSGVEAVNYYATGTIYKDFADGTRSQFVKHRADGSVELREDLVSDNLGVYGELGIGAAYTRVLQSGRKGRPKQFSATVRVDGRSGDSLDSVGVTAQMRLQF